MESDTDDHKQPHVSLSACLGTLDRSAPAAFAAAASASVVTWRVCQRHRCVGMPYARRPTYLRCSGGSGARLMQRNEKRKIRTVPSKPHLRPHAGSSRQKGRHSTLIPTSRLVIVDASESPPRWRACGDSLGSVELTVDRHHPPRVWWCM